MACENHEPLDPYCPICHEIMVAEVCWLCYGAGGYHDCGEDCCCCRDPDGDLNEPCMECDEQGEYLVCPNAGRHPEVRSERAD